MQDIQKLFCNCFKKEESISKSEQKPTPKSVEKTDVPIHYNMEILNNYLLIYPMFPFYNYSYESYQKY